MHEVEAGGDQCSWAVRPQIHKCTEQHRTYHRGTVPPSNLPLLPATGYWLLAPGRWNNSTPASYETKKLSQRGPVARRTASCNKKALATYVVVPWP